MCVLNSLLLKVRDFTDLEQIYTQTVLMISFDHSHKFGTYALLLDLITIFFVNSGFDISILLFILFEEDDCTMNT